jgi:hypothetical protein
MNNRFWSDLQLTNIRANKCALPLEIKLTELLVKTNKPKPKRKERSKPLQKAILTLNDLKKVQHLKVQDAGKALGISFSQFKRILAAKKLVWPERHLKKIQTLYPYIEQNRDKKKFQLLLKHNIFKTGGKFPVHLEKIYKDAHLKYRGLMPRLKRRLNKTLH